jgi:hypothetical protein
MTSGFAPSVFSLRIDLKTSEFSREKCDCPLLSDSKRSRNNGPQRRSKRWTNRSFGSGPPKVKRFSESLCVWQWKDRLHFKRPLLRLARVSSRLGISKVCAPQYCFRFEVIFGFASNNFSAPAVLRGYPLTFLTGGTGF